MGSGVSHEIAALLRDRELADRRPPGIAAKVFDRCTDDYIPRRLSTYQSEAEILGTKNAVMVRDLFVELGASVFFVSRVLFTSFICWLFDEMEEKRLHGDCVFPFLAQDETTMKTSDRGRNQSAVWRRARGKTKPSSSAIVPTEEATDGTGNYSAVITKILQSELCIAFLVSRLDTFFVYVAELPTPLQRTMQGNHRQLFAAVREATGIAFMESLWRKFDHEIHLSNADRGSGGLKMDRLFQAMFPSIPRLCGLGCFSHMANTGQKSQMDILEETVSGMVAFSLTVKEDGKWDQCRNNAADILYEMAVAVYNTPPQHQLLTSWCVTVSL